MKFASVSAFATPETLSLESVFGGGDNICNVVAGELGCEPTSCICDLRNSAKARIGSPGNCVEDIVFADMFGAVLLRTILEDERSASLFLTVFTRSVNGFCAGGSSFG